jgi:hypothetical protein
MKEQGGAFVREQALEAAYMELSWYEAYVSMSNRAKGTRALKTTAPGVLLIGPHFLNDKNSITIHDFNHKTTGCFKPTHETTSGE